jgi:plasmid maintenance system killer protein
MIRNFRHKGLERLFRNSDRRGIDAIDVNLEDYH